MYFDLAEMDLKLFFYCITKSLSVFRIFFISSSLTRKVVLGCFIKSKTSVRIHNLVMGSGVKSRVRVGFGCHPLGFGSGSGVGPRVPFGFRVFSGFKK